MIASSTISVSKVGARDALEIFLRPEIYSAMADDSCPKNPAELENEDIDASDTIFLGVERDGNRVGIFWFIRDRDGYEVHTGLLPGCRGSLAVEAAHAGMEWIFTNTDAKFIQSYAWSDQPQVRWFCHRVGMTETGTGPWPNTRNGHTVSITHYSITKEEYQCLPSR